jgi:hypothetical protein
MKFDTICAIFYILQQIYCVSSILSGEGFSNLIRLGKGIVKQAKNPAPNFFGNKVESESGFLLIYMAKKTVIFLMFQDMNISRNTIL